jgi:hypothetical protein
MYISASSNGAKHLQTDVSVKFYLPEIVQFFYNETELGVGIDPGMALTPLPSSIGRGLNPRPSDRELSALPLDHGFEYSFLIGQTIEVQIVKLRLHIQFLHVFSTLGYNFLLLTLIEQNQGKLQKIAT